MATEVQTGHGSTFALDDGTGSNLVLIGEPTNIPIPSGTTELINASHYQSVDYMDYIAAPLKDGEEAELVMNWIPGSTTDDLLNGALNETREFEIVIPAGEGATSDGTYTFTGSVLVRNYVRENPMDDKRTGTLTVKWVGAITETYVAPV